MSKMEDTLRYLYVALSGIRLAPIIAYSMMIRSRKLIFSDQDRWATLLNRKVPGNVFERVYLFAYMLTMLPEYRNVLAARIGAVGYLFWWLSPKIPVLKISSPKIGPGLCVIHGHGTLVSANAIGANFTVHHLVTVGYRPSDDTRPTIGDNVTIFAGAVIVGNIRIGDNAKVGANSLVIADVPAGATVVGVPARVVAAPIC